MCIRDRNNNPGYYDSSWNGVARPAPHTISGDPGWWAFPYMKDVVAAMLRNYIDTSLAQTIHEKRGIMIKLADETVGLKTLRSSNHSENRPNMSITYAPTSGGGAGYYGSARSYDNWKFSQGQYPNCWGYALYQTYSIEPQLPHQYNNDTPATDNYCKNAILTYTNENISNVTMRNLSSINGVIEHYEHRVAARMNASPTPPGTGTNPSSGWILQAYHFAVQTSSGRWAHKNNLEASIYLDVTVDPTNNNSGMWNVCSGQNMTPTFFFACTT